MQVGDQLGLSPSRSTLERTPTEVLSVHSGSVRFQHARWSSCIELEVNKAREQGWARIRSFVSMSLVVPDSPN
jgi:hypothetical protein